MLDALTIELSPIQWGAVLGASLVGAVVDLRCRKLPNWLTAPLFLTGLAWSAWAGGLGGLGSSFLAALLVMLPFVILFVVAGGGAGDAKMMGGIGAWLGLQAGIVTLVSVMVCGIVLGLAWAAANGRLGSVLRNLGSTVTVWTGSMAAKQGVVEATKTAAPREGMTAMPYGLSILVGVCVAAGVIVL